MRTEQMISEVLKVMRQSIKFAFAIAFMKKDKKKVTSGENEEPVVRAPPPEENKEFTSQAAMVVTEAIYKFIRRN